MARGYGYFEDSYTNFDYDAWLTSPTADEERYYGYADEEEDDDYDYCDAHEEELKISGKWGK